MIDFDPFDGERDPKSDANASMLGTVCAIFAALIALQTCWHVGTYTAEAGIFVLRHLYMYAVMCAGSYGIVYYAVRWIERNMTHVTTLALMATVFAVVAIKAAEFVMLRIWAGSEYALEWLALAASDPMGWLFVGEIIR